MPDDQVKIKKEQSASDGMVCCSDGDHYPYGTSLSFDNDLIESLGIDNLAIGDIVEVRGFAFVERKSEYSTADHSDKSLGIQMTSIKLQRETGDVVEQMYGPKS